MDTPISKPALLRQTFELGAAYSGNLLSLNKMLGMLQDAGNAATLAGYINLLNESGLLCGLQKFGVDMARRRASIPKLQVYNNALKTLYSPLSFEQAIADRKAWGHIFESGVGAYLICQAFAGRFEVFYWREKMMRWILCCARMRLLWLLRSRVMPKSVRPAWINSVDVLIRRRLLWLEMVASALRSSFRWISTDC